MSNKPRRRLDTETRRAQLLGIGSELFAKRPYDDVWVDDVAELAGVSRGLLYHYFENKRGFLRAVIEHETQVILAATAPDLGLPPSQRLRASIDAYLDYVINHPHGYRTLFRGTVSADEDVRELVDDNLRRQEQRILAAAGHENPSEALRLSVHGSIASLIAIVLDWLDNPTVDRSTITDLAVGSLACALAIDQRPSGAGHAAAEASGQHPRHA